MNTIAPMALIASTTPLSAIAPGIFTVAYLVAGVLFILSLGGLAGPTSARRGNFFGMLGMAIAIGVTAAAQSQSLGLLAGVLVAGGAVGAVLALRVEMTAMPQLVALLHSFVGAAAVLVGIGSYLAGSGPLIGSEATFHEVELFIGVFAGAVTFTGSVVAFAKLQGLIGGRPLLLPGRHAMNLAMVIACVALGSRFLGAGVEAGLAPLLAMTAIAAVLGAHLVAAIGGADMPVVVSMLNSYSGWTAAAAGFVLDYDLLVITGALVGSSGAILSYVMCRAMNRSFASVILGGFGADEGKAPARTGVAIEGEVKSIDAAGAAELLREARAVIVIPGYGMAVSRAQDSLRELVDILKKRGKTVRFAIHPVAGRLPGHMNVLLAEARIPYDLVLEMEEINEDFPETDVALVVGANDIVNPGAQTDPSSPIYGMPVLEAWKAKCVVVFKRSLASGYAGVENALFYEENARLLFGDAKHGVDAILGELRADQKSHAVA